MTKFFSTQVTSVKTNEQKTLQRIIELSKQLGIREEQQAAIKFTNGFSALTQHQNTARLFQPVKTHHQTNASPKNTMGPRNGR